MGLLGVGLKRERGGWGERGEKRERKAWMSVGPSAWLHTDIKRREAQKLRGEEAQRTQAYPSLEFLRVTGVLSKRVCFEVLSSTVLCEYDINRKPEDKNTENLWDTQKCKLFEKSFKYLEHIRLALIWRWQGEKGKQHCPQRAVPPWVSAVTGLGSGTWVWVSGCKL